MAIPPGMSLRKYKQQRDKEKEIERQKEEASKRKSARISSSHVKRKRGTDDYTTVRPVKTKPDDETKSSSRHKSCDPCRKMKTKCSTARPCERCDHMGIACVQGKQGASSKSKPKQSVHTKKASLPIATNDDILAQKRAIEILSMMLHKTRT